MNAETESLKKQVFVSLRTRLLLVFSVLLTLTLIGIFIWVNSFVFDLILDRIRQDMLALVRTAAIEIEGETHARLYQTGEMDDPDYLSINAALRAVKHTNPIASGMYTYMQLPEEPNQIRLIVSAAVPPGITPEQRDIELAQTRLTGCQVDPTSRPKMNVAYEPPAEVGADFFQGLNTPTVTAEIYKDDWGTWLSAFAPITDATGQAAGAVGVDVCVADIVQLQTRIRNAMLLTFLMILLLLAAGVSLVTYGITRPIATLTRAAEEVGRGHYEQDFAGLYQGRFRDEVSRMAQVFESMVKKVYERESDLKKQVVELQIIIDEQKKQKQVNDIVESDFFRDLQTRASAMRDRSHRRSQDGS